MEIHNQVVFNNNNQSIAPVDIDNLFDAYEEPFDADLLGDII